MGMKRARSYARADTRPTKSRRQTNQAMVAVPRTPRFATQSFVRKMLDRQLETKVHTWNVAPVGIGLTGGIYNLLGDSSNRIPYVGSSFEILKIEIIWEVGVADADNQFRALFLRTKTDNFTPSVASIFVNGIVIPYRDNIDYVAQRDEITIMDETFVPLDNSSNRTRVFKHVLRKKDWVIHTAPAASPTYQGKDWPYLCVASDSAVSAHPGFGAHIKILYRDA